MQKSLLTHSKSELIALLKTQQQVNQYQNKVLAETKVTLAQQSEKVAQLEHQLAYFQKKFFGQSRERFVNPDQLALPFVSSTETTTQKEEVFLEKIAYVRKKNKKKHPGRMKLPDHLPVKEIEIYPEGDLSEMVCIGKEITEELECIPEQFYIKRYIRYKYAPRDKNGKVHIGMLPTRIIEKGIPGPGLLATLLVNKYVDHLPLYRQQERFKRQGIPFASSSIEGWVRQSLEALCILYEYSVEDIKSKGYLQVDETIIKVLDPSKKGSTHQGYYWTYHSPLDAVVLLDYSPSRGAKAPLGILENFEGYLQSDGYRVYEAYGAKDKVIPVMCWAHARRKFVEAQNNDQKRAGKALIWIQALYKIEEQAREEQHKPEQRKKLRQTRARPILDQFKQWLDEEAKQTLPKSPIGQAITYCLNRWAGLENYLLDGSLEIDNNLVENAIRPIALGRKNYLFAGSHAAAKRAAAIYSFFATCKKHQVNPWQWVKYVLENLMTTSRKNIHELYPQNFKKTLEKQSNHKHIQVVQEMS